MDLIDRLLDPAVLPLLIPIIAIVGGFGIGISAMVIGHLEKREKFEIEKLKLRERLAMISQGMHPDEIPIFEDDDQDIEYEDDKIVEQQDAPPSQPLERLPDPLLRD